MSAPITPTGAPHVTKNSITYTFSCTDSTVDTITFQCEGPHTSTTKTPANATAVTFTDLEHGATYTLQATPRTNDGTELPTVIFPPVTTCNLPQPPTDAVFTSTDNTTLQVSWIPAYSLANDAPKWYVLESTDRVVRLTIEGWRTTYTSYPITGGTYTFNLYAVNDAGYSTPVTSPQSYNFI